MYVNIYTNVADYPAESSTQEQVVINECNVCGEAHETSSCPLLVQKVEDKSVPSRARLSLPPNLSLGETPDGSPRVVAREEVPVGTQFGPVEAPRYRQFKGEPRFRLKVFPTKGRATCLDTSDEYQCNWMCFVEPAPDASLQNLIAYQLGQDIYFSVQKHVSCGDALFVGYAPPYGRKMVGPPEEPPAPVVLVPEQQGGPPMKRKRGRPPRNASVARSTTVTIIPQVDHSQSLPTSESTDAPETNWSPVGAAVPCYERKQWRCSQCGRLYRDSVVFARHLQDHYRPAYLRELASKQQRGGASRRGRPRRQGSSQFPSIGRNSSSSPAGPGEDHASSGQETTQATTDGADHGEQDNSVNEGQSVLEAPVEETQLESLLGDKGPMQLMIQLQDGTLHEIMSYPSNPNLPTLVENNQVQFAGDASAVGSDGSVTLATLDQLPLQPVAQVAQLRGAKRGRKRKGEAPRETAPPPRFESVERQSAGKYNLRTTRKALVVDEDRLENDSDYEGDDYSDYDSNVDDEYDELPDQVPSENGPANTGEPGEGAAHGEVPKELHVAVEMLTSLTSQMTQQNGPLTHSVPTGGTEEPKSSAEGRSDAEAQGSRQDDGPTAQGTDDSQGEGVHVVEKFYRSVEQARMDRPKRPGRYRCDLCGKGFNQTLYLFRHIRKHTGEFTCPRCRRVFARKENLVKHACCGVKSGEHSEVVDYPCTMCDKSFGTDRLLRRHMAKHTGQYKCRDCNKSYTTREILLNHSCARHPPLERFSCGVCGKSFTRHNYLLKHLPVHTGQHECPICGKWLRSLDSLANHVRMCTQVQEIQLHGRASCSHCHKEFTNAAEFRRHQYEHTHVHRCGVCGGRFRNMTLLNAHVCQGRPMECDGCGEVFETVSALDEHRASHGEPQFKCELCGKAFFKEVPPKHPCVNLLDPSTADSTRRKRDPNLAPLVCEICGSTFSSTSSLNVHKNLHGEKRFQCDVCGKRFHRKDLLLEHHAVHGEPTFPCPTCRKLFKTKKSLDVHTMIHNGVKRFKCSVCSKEFFQKGNLQKHEDTHLSERRHRCTVCQKVFTTRESLGRHMLEHTRGKIFTCGICGRAFVKEHQLRNHHRMFHSNQSYTCLYCGLCLKLRHSLKRHLRKQHPDQEAHWRNPDVLNGMLVSKGLDDNAATAGNPSDLGLDPNSAVEGLQQVSVGGSSAGLGGFEATYVQDSGSNMVTGTAQAMDMDQSLVADVISNQGSEVLLAVEGLNSEELREAIATGRAQIKQGPTPDTIEISMPFDVADGEQVTYMANLMDASNHVVVDGSSTSTIELQAGVEQLGAEQCVVSGATDMVPGDGDCTEEQQQYITLPLYQADDATEGRKELQGIPVQEVAGLDASTAGNLAYQDPPRYVLTGQELSDATHVIYDAGNLPKQAVSQGAILLDDGTILQQEEQQDRPTDLLLYVLTTSETQGDE